MLLYYLFIVSLYLQQIGPVQKHSKVKKILWPVLTETISFTLYTLIEWWSNNPEKVLTSAKKSYFYQKSYFYLFRHVTAKNWFAQTIPDKIFGTKKKRPVKLYWTRKIWYLIFRIFWLLQRKFNFWNGD